MRAVKFINLWFLGKNYELRVEREQRDVFGGFNLMWNWFLMILDDGFGFRWEKRRRCAKKLVLDEFVAFDLRLSYFEKFFEWLKADILIFEEKN